MNLQWLAMQLTRTMVKVRLRCCRRLATICLSLRTHLFGGSKKKKIWTHMIRKKEQTRPQGFLALELIETHP